MANINLASLNMFRAANNWTADSIANLDGGKAIKKVGDYSGPFSALGRTDVEKAANNEARTALLKALGTAFGMEGMTVQDGKARFTREFLRNLEKKLGVDFKRDDFTLDAAGFVNSGRPLTARRIKAILNKVTLAAANEATAGWSEGAGSTGATFTSRADAMTVKAGMGTKGATSHSGQTGKTDKTKDVDISTIKSSLGPVKTQFGLRKEVYNPLFAKLDIINDKLKGAPKHVKQFYERIGKSLDYLANQLDTERAGDLESDKSALRNSMEYEFTVLELGDKLKDGMNKFEYYDPKQRKYVPLKSTYDFNNNILWHAIGGGLIHLERATRIDEDGKEVSFSVKSAPDIKPLRKYIANTLRLLVNKAIDLYFASEKAGKLNEFFEHLKEPGACIEDQGLHLVKFEADHLTKADAMSAEDARALNLIADGKAPDLPETTVNQFMMVLEDFEGEEFFSPEKGWNKEVSDGVKAQLRGKKCTMQDFDAPHKLGEKVPELVGKNGLPVVKEFTDELIDQLGPKVLKEYFRK